VPKTCRLESRRSQLQLGFKGFRDFPRLWHGIEPCQRRAGWKAGAPSFSSDGFRSGLRVFAISYVFGAALSRAKDVPAGKPALPVKPASNRRVLLIGNCPVPQESEIRCWIVSKEASPDGRPV
jgi:hypothetical protein